MGLCELVALVGLDTRLSILRFLHRTLGEKFRPCPLIEQYVAAGRLGRKSGKGVYDYPAEEPDVTQHHTAQWRRGPERHPPRILPAAQRTAMRFDDDDPAFGDASLFVGCDRFDRL